VRQPFGFDITTANVSDPYQDDHIEFQQSHGLWYNKTVKILVPPNGYSRIAKAALEILTRFAPSYFYEQGFSRMVEIKSKRRTRLDCENDMRVALSKTEPRIFEIYSKNQQQMTH